MEAINNEFTDYLYTPIGEIKQELLRRRNDPNLKKQVEEFWGPYFPSFLINQKRPEGFFSRPTITPNYEFLFFLDIIKIFGTPPVIMEFADKFATINEAKYYVASIHIEQETRRHKFVPIKNTIVDIPKWEGKPLVTVETTAGKNLQELHHEMLFHYFPELTDKIVDITVWFDTVRKSYETYYLGYLALGIYHGVIFENFLFDDEKEVDFFEKKVLPSFIELEKIFGVKPLIHPVLPLRSAKMDRWYYYPPSTADVLKQKNV